MKIKRAIIVSLLLVLALTLFGCNGSGKVDDKTEKTSSVAVETEEAVSHNEDVTSCVTDTTGVISQETSLPADTTACESTEETTEGVYEEPQLNFSDLE